MTLRNPPLDPNKAVLVIKRMLDRYHPRRAAICGGFAMLAYGGDRHTRDIDVIANDLPADQDGAAGPLTFGGRTYSVSGVVVDWIVRDDDKRDVYQEALNDIRHLSPWKGAPRLPFISPEWLAITKLLSGRPKDLQDLDTLIRSPHFKRNVLRAHARRIYGSHAYLLLDDFEQLFLEADLMPKR